MIIRSAGRDDLAIIAVNADSGRPGADGLKTIRDYADRLDIIFPVLLDSERAMQSAYAFSRAAHGRGGRRRRSHFRHPAGIRTDAPGGNQGEYPRGHGRRTRRGRNGGGDKLRRRG